MTSASIVITYTYGATSQTEVVLSKDISSDIEKKIFDYFYRMVIDKLDATKNSGIVKVLLSSI